MSYSDYTRMASGTFYGGRIRRTPWYLKLLGYKPYRQWFSRGPQSIHDNPDHIWNGHWQYYDKDPRR